MGKRSKVKPPKPYSTFPLFAHANGSWTKTIQGQHVRFGRWRWPEPEEYTQSWKAALIDYQRHEEAIAKGDRFLADPRAVNVQTVTDGYLSQQHHFAEKGRIKGRTFAERRVTVNAFRDAVGADTTVGQLEANPEPIRKFVEEMDQSLGFHRYNNAMQRLRSMWRWAAHPNDGVLGGVAFRWIDLFQKRQIREFRRQRRRDREAGVLKSFAPDEVRALVDHAQGQIRAMVLLGYFAAYGNTDLGELPDSTLKVMAKAETIHLHGHEEVIPAGWGKMYYPRPKTELDRWAIVPPIVCDALAETRAMRAKPRLASDNAKQFLTETGLRVCYEVIHRDDEGLIERVTVTDNIAQKWYRLLDRLGRCDDHGWQVRKQFTRDKTEDDVKVLFCPTCGKTMKPMQRRGFYCLRHTATTIAATSGASSDTRSLFEGHSAGEANVRQTFYMDPSQLHDLFLIGRHLATSIGLPMQSAKTASPAAPEAETTTAA